jgi:hypothetical protein
VKGDFLKGGFMQMISAIFTTIMSSLTTLYGTEGASSFIAFQTVITIIPTILLLAASIAAGIFYVKGYNKLAGGGQDPSGLLRMILGILQIVLFVTMFATVITNFYSLYTAYGTNTTWIAFGTVITIIPTILFLSGIFSGGLVAFGGGKQLIGRGKGKGQAASSAEA